MATYIWSRKLRECIFNLKHKKESERKSGGGYNLSESKALPLGRLYLPTETPTGTNCLTKTTGEIPHSNHKILLLTDPIKRFPLDNYTVFPLVWLALMPCILIFSIVLLSIKILCYSENLCGHLFKLLQCEPRNLTAPDRIPAHWKQVHDETS